jgi:hypothetical protein
LDQLCLSGQYGFSFPVESNALSYDEEVAKLEVIVEVAQDVWRLSHLELGRPGLTRTAAPADQPGAKGVSRSG